MRYGSYLNLKATAFVVLLGGGTLLGVSSAAWAQNASSPQWVIKWRCPPNLLTGLSDSKDKLSPKMPLKAELSGPQWLNVSTNEL